MKLISQVRMTTCPSQHLLHNIWLTLASCPMGNKGSIPADKAAGARSWSLICTSCQG